MATIGIELCDAGIQTAAVDDANSPAPLEVPDGAGHTEWPGFCHAEGAKLVFGRGGEDNWFVHPRRVLHTFWARLAHEPSTLSNGTKLLSFSELSYFFLREYAARLKAAKSVDKIAIAVPSAYLKDAATEDEKIGLLLGMAGELKLPVAGLVDMACAALCDPRAHGFNPALPVVVIDLQLEGADITLCGTDGKLERKDFIHLPNSGYAHLLKLITGTMGNRFLRHTAFDILEDGRIEQTFFRQTKEFLLSDAPEWRYHINTATRGYEMTAKREQLAGDTHAFAQTLVQGLQTFLQQSPHHSEPCTIALTDRTGHLPGIETKLRTAGFSRLLRLPRGAAACGAARIAANRLAVPSDLADVPLEKSVPLTDTHRGATSLWEARLHKHRHTQSRLIPTHAIMEGVGHVLGTKPRFLIGLGELGADLVLPESFGAATDCTVPLLHEGGRLWFLDQGRAHGAAGISRTTIDAGDHLTIRCGQATANILFAHCPDFHSQHGSVD